MSTDTRIATLESQIRTLKRMLFGVLGVVVVGGLLAATTLQKVPDVIQAKKFEVIGQHGKSKAVFGIGPFESVKANEPYIAFKNKDGKGIAGMGVVGGGGALVLSRRDGSDYAEIAHVDQGSAFALLNKHGKKSVVLADQVSNGGVIELSRPDGSDYAVIGHADQGSAFALLNKHGKKTVVLEDLVSNGGTIELSRPDGSDYAVIEHADQGSAFGLLNKHGKKTVLLEDVVSYGGALELSRPDGSSYTGIANKDENATIEIRDKKGNAKAILLMKGEQPFIGCVDSKGDMAVEITVSKSGSSVTCMGPGGSLMKGGALFGGGSTYFGGGAIGLWNMDGEMKILGPPPGLTEEDKKLLEACAKGGASVSAIQALVQSGADVNRPWFNPADYAMGHDTNLTALMLAAKNQSNPAVLSALLNAGADANATSSKGNKAIEFARLNKKLKGTNAIQELEAAMKKD